MRCTHAQCGGSIVGSYGEFSCLSCGRSATEPARQPWDLVEEPIHTRHAGAKSNTRLCLDCDTPLKAKGAQRCKSHAQRFRRPA